MTTKQPDETDKQTVRIQKIKKYGLIAAGLFLVYVILGFLVVPPLLKPRVEEQLASLLGRRVTIENIKLNPLLLTSTTSNLTIYEKEGEPFAGFAELFANAQLSSIFTWAITLREIRVQKPFGVLKILPGNQLNISDILAKLSEPSAEPKEKEEKSGLPRAVIERFQVVDGKVVIEDHWVEEPIHEVFTPITFELENLSTLKDREGEYQFVGAGPLGGKFELHGKIVVNPPSLQGSFSTKETQLPHVWEHIKEQVSFQISKGSVNTSGEVAMAMVDGELNAKVQNVTFDLTDFELVEKGKEELLIALPTFSVQGISADLNTQEIVVGQVRTADAAITSWFSADGSTELQRLFQPDIEKLMAIKASHAPEAEGEAGPPWHATLRSMEVRNWRLILDDVTGEKPIRETFTLDSFTVENASTKKNNQGDYAFSGTGPSGGHYQLDGQMSVDPVWTQGRYVVADVQLAHFWEHIKAYLSVQIAKGSTGASGDYTLALNEGAIDAQLENGKVELNQFELVEKGRKEVLISIPVLTVREIGGDLQAREIRVGNVRTADGKIRSWLSADGTFGLRHLFLGDLETLKELQADGDKEPESSSGEPWQLLLKKMAVDNWGLAFEDRTLAKPASLSADNIKMVLENFSNKRESQGDLKASLQVNRSGTVDVKGTAGIDPIQADLKVSTAKIALKPFQPYVDDAVNARIASGSTSSSGRVRYQQKDTANSQIQYQGEVSVDDVEIQDTTESKDFITLSQFKASGIALDLVPNKLYTADVLIDRPHARVTIDQNGVVNVVNAFTPSKEDGDGKQNLLQRLVSFLILQFKGPMPMQVDRVQLSTFTADFLDASVSPSFNTHLEIKEGSVKGLSSDPSAKADFKMEGSIDQSATIQANGQMNPMNALKYSRVNFSLKDFRLPPVSPYSGKFIGYKIDRGSLHTNLTYKVNQDKVHGDNIIRIDQLELGDSVESPDAINLPIKLGVALLKDSKGRIAVQVPVDGDVRDPQFDIADAITSALTGTITNAGDDPFSTIMEIDGFTGEELRSVVFAFGSSELQEREARKLQALATFLKERTSLKLEVRATAHPKMDALAFAGKLTEQDPTEEALSPEEEAKREKEEAAIVESVEVGRLQQLAKERFETVRTYLVEKAMLDTERIGERPIEILETGEPGNGLVELFLSVD